MLKDIQKITKPMNKQNICRLEKLSNEITELRKEQ